MPKIYNDMKVAVVGATGMVGNVMLKVLAERNFPVTELIPVASERSVGKTINFQNKEFSVVGLETAVEMCPDVALFSAGGATSLEWAPKFAAAGTTVIGIGVSTVFVSNTITGVSTSVFTFTQVSSSSNTTNTNQTYIINSDGVGVSTFTSTTASDWYNQQKLGLTKGADIAWNTIAEKPGTSEYAESRDAKNDEMHIVVIDEDGSASGIPGNILEKHLYLSKAKDGKRQPAEDVYYKNYLANKSEFIF